MRAPNNTGRYILAASSLFGLRALLVAQNWGDQLAIVFMMIISALAYLSENNSVSPLKGQNDLFRELDYGAEICCFTYFLYALYEGLKPNRAHVILACVFLLGARYCSAPTIRARIMRVVFCFHWNIIKYALLKEAIVSLR